MKKFVIFIIMVSIFSGFFLPGLLRVPSNTNIAFAEDPSGDSGNGDDGTTTGGSDTESTGGSPIQTPEPPSMFSCSFSFNAAAFLNCLGLVFYIPFYITHYIAVASGLFLDVMLDYSTQSASYESGFVSEGWKIIRDLTNIGFIFALLYIAINTIVGQGSAKSTLVWVIIMALVVNFSFFTTRVVIDASNILARVFYQNINIQDENADPNQTTKSITAALISKINIQNIENDVSASLREEPRAMEPWKVALAGILVTILVTIVNAVMIFVFFSIAMLFVGRVIGLWFSIIASPLAFLSIAFPGGKAWRRVGWDAWSGDLIGTAFLAPVFLFFIYLIILFLNTGFLTDAMSGGVSISSVLVGIIVPFAFFMTLLLTAKNIASELAGQIASTVTGYLNTAMKVAAGGALAGGAMLGGAAVTGAGALGARIGASQGTGRMAKLAQTKMGQGTGKFLRKANLYGKDINWDPRNSTIGKGINKMGSMAGVGNVLPTFGQDTSAKFGSAAGIKDWSEKRGEEWRKKKQKRADDLAEDTAKYTKDPNTGKTYRDQADEAQGDKDEFMARFGHVLEKLDENIKDSSQGLRDANQALQAAEKSGTPKDISDAKIAQSKALTAYNDANEQKDKFKKGNPIVMNGESYTGKVNGKNLEQINATVKETKQKEARAMVDARMNYSESMKNTGGAEKTLDFILSGGASSGEHAQAARDVQKKASDEAKKPTSTT